MKKKNSPNSSQMRISPGSSQSTFKRTKRSNSTQSTFKRTKRSNSTHGRWSSLPDEILVTIAELLTSPDGTDFARFRAVCRSCRSAAAKVNFTLVRQMPWIMLPTTNHSRETQIFNPLENKLYKLPLPEARWTTVCGSVKEWVAVVSDDLRIDLFNLNPFMQHPRKVSLPSIHGIGPPCGPQYGNFVIKICLPSSPIEDPNGMVVALYGNYAQLAFTRLGSRVWTSVSSSIPSSYCDVVFYKGRFYATNFLGDVVKLDFRRRRAVKIASRSMASAALYYLVESAGDLLQVGECCDSGLMRVFKLDFGSGEWEAVRSLGEHSLFLGAKNYSTSVHAPELFGCRSNCIYFIDDHYNSVDAMVVFSLDDDKIIETHNMGQTDIDSLIPPLWVSPFICWQKVVNTQESDIRKDS